MYYEVVDPGRAAWLIATCKPKIIIPDACSTRLYGAKCPKCSNELLVADEYHNSDGFFACVTALLQYTAMLLMQCFFRYDYDTFVCSDTKCGIVRNFRGSGAW